MKEMAGRKRERIDRQKSNKECSRQETRKERQEENKKEVANRKQGRIRWQKTKK